MSEGVNQVHEVAAARFGAGGARAADCLAFERYEVVYDQNVIRYALSLDDVPCSIEVRTALADVPIATRPAVERAAFNLGIALVVQFYPRWCTTTVRIAAGPLDAEQQAFWQDVIRKGSGETFYRNQIDFRERARLIVTAEVPAGHGTTTTNGDQPARATAPSVLVPIGGGKDSIVVAELLRAAGIEFTWFFLRDPLSLGLFDACQNAIRASGVTRLLECEYVILPDPRLLEFQTFPGHYPYSVVLAFATTLVALVHGFDHVAIGQERSSDSPNTTYLGMDINHQYTKSGEFERACRRYLARHVTPRVEYFSALRHLHEIEIAEIFSRHPAYFGAFLSCNSRTAWCGKCAKCAFVYALLAAFLPPTTMAGIFGRDLLADDDLRETFEELLGLRGVKPWDCVGTSEEATVALAAARAQYAAADIPEPRMLASLALPDVAAAAARLAATPDESSIPPELSGIRTTTSSLAARGFLPRGT